MEWRKTIFELLTVINSEGEKTALQPSRLASQVSRTQTGKVILTRTLKPSVGWKWPRELHGYR